MNVSAQAGFREELVLEVQFDRMQDETGRYGHYDVKGPLPSPLGWLGLDADKSDRWRQDPQAPHTPAT